MFSIVLFAFTALVVRTDCRSLPSPNVISTPLSTANNQFGLQLLNQLSDDENNVFISPFSISNAFAMLYSGAKGGTAQELRRVLGYELANMTDQQLKEEFKSLLEQIESGPKQYELRVANKMLVQNDFELLETFHENLRKYFKSNVESVDFADNPLDVMSSVNQFVNQQTNGKIKKLLDEPLSGSTRLLLLNAVYFEAKFRKRFERSESHISTFYENQDKEYPVMMMQKFATLNHTEVPELDSQLLEVPYKDNDISLYVLLPNQRQGLRSYRTLLTDFSLIDRKISELKERVVSATIPRFNVSTSYSLAKDLNQLGVRSAFGNDADLSGINGQQNLQVSKVLHKAYVEMSEEGTKAAAVTGISAVLKNKLIPPKDYITFKADHPFMFFIRNNKNGIVLFSGHINKINTMPEFA